LGEIARFALCHDSGIAESGGERPNVHLVLTLEELERRARGVILHTGEKLSAAALRRHLCDAQVIPHVLGGKGEILDVGRAKRTIPTAIRRALIIRDRGCAFPGCDKPPGWTEAHHVVAWQHGGPTEINNLVLLCGQHHDVLHRTEWEVHIRNGTPEFTPPPWARAASDSVP
jgi:5-methylcytosine-specific restriction protein A